MLNIASRENTRGEVWFYLRQQLLLYRINGIFTPLSLDACYLRTDLFLSCRFWLVGQHNDEGLYDIVFCHICRKEEFDFFLCLDKVIKGGAHTLASVPQAIKAMIGAIPARVMPFLERGVFLEGEKERPEAAPAQEGAVSPYTDLTQDLGDRLTEYELVEDLIERGTLEENADGTLSIRLQ